MNRLLLRVRFGVFSTYAPLEQDISALRGQLIFRSKNLGMRELDLIVGSWALRTLPSYTYQQLLTYNKEVLNHETPELLKKILGQLPIAQNEQLINDIRAYAVDSTVSKIENT